MFGIKPARRGRTGSGAAHQRARCASCSGTGAMSRSPTTPSATLRVKRPRAAAALGPPVAAHARRGLHRRRHRPRGRRAARRSAPPRRSRAPARAGAVPTRRRPRDARHTRRDDREAIQHHYDVSNEFYALWLDPRMVYSCAYFRTEGDSLEQAQLAEARPHLPQAAARARRALPRHRLRLGRARDARRRAATASHATGITLSENQHRLANERIRAAGLQDRCRVLLQDYRDHPGEGAYDRIASVGMFEHVGLRNLPVVLRRGARGCCASGGLFLNHGITSSDTRQPRRRPGRRRVHRPLRLPAAASCRTCTAWCAT